MAKTKVTNASPGVLAIPGLPVLGPGRTCTVTGTPESVLDAIGGFEKVGEAIIVEQVADSATADPVPTAAYVGTARAINSGAGLTGGGDLTADRTLAVDFGEVGDVAAESAGAAAAAGILNESARADHVHALAAGEVGDIAAVGTAAAAGVLTSVARADHAHAHGAQTVGTLHAAATTAVNGFMSAADKARTDGALSKVCRALAVTNPATASTTGVHAGFAGNDASNDFPGPFTNPDVPRNVTVTFAAGWDGGNVNIVGTDQYDQAVNETINSAPGTTAAGAKIFKTVTAATKSAVGAAADTASIGIGDKLGVVANIADAVGIMTVDGIAEAVVIDATYDGFTPTTLPNGARDYVLVANL